MTFTSSSKSSPGQECIVGFGDRPSQSYWADASSSIVIGTDGAAYVELFESHDTSTRVCHVEYIIRRSHDDGGPLTARERYDRAPGEGAISAHRQMRLMRISSSGESNIVDVWGWQHAGPDTTEPQTQDEYAYVGTIVPDGIDGALAAWTHADQVNNVYEGHIARMSDGSVVDHTLDSSWPSVVFVSDTAVYLQGWTPNGDPQLSAIDPTTWSQKWAITTYAVPAVALDNGHAFVVDPTAAEIRELDELGVTVSTTASAMPLMLPVPLLRGYNVLTALDVNLTLAAISTPEATEARYFSVPGSRAIDSRCAISPPPVGSHIAIDIIPIRYRFETLANWTDSQLKAVRKAFTLWQKADAKTSLNLQFEETTSTNENLLLKKEVPYKDGIEVIGLTTPTDGPALGYHRATIKFTTNQTYLKNPMGYLKLGLHEIGHLHGLDHTDDKTEVPGASVMNRWLYTTELPTPDDQAQYVPISVQYCDYINAKTYMR